MHDTCHTHTPDHLTARPYTPLFISTYCSHYIHISLQIFHTFTSPTHTHLPLHFPPYTTLPHYTHTILPHTFPTCSTHHLPAHTTCHTTVIPHSPPTCLYQFHCHHPNLHTPHTTFHISPTSSKLWDFCVYPCLPVTSGTIPCHLCQSLPHPLLHTCLFMVSHHVFVYLCSCHLFTAGRRDFGTSVGLFFVGSHYCFVLDGDSHTPFLLFLRTFAHYLPAYLYVSLPLPVPYTTLPAFTTTYHLPPCSWFVSPYCTYLVYSSFLPISHTCVRKFLTYAHTLPPPPFYTPTFLPPPFRYSPFPCYIPPFPIPCHAVLTDFFTPPIEFPSCLLLHTQFPLISHRPLLHTFLHTHTTLTGRLLLLLFGHGCTHHLHVFVVLVFICSTHTHHFVLFHFIFAIHFCFCTFLHHHACRAIGIFVPHVCILPVLLPACICLHTHMGHVIYCHHTTHLHHHTPTAHCILHTCLFVPPHILPCHFACAMPLHTHTHTGQLGFCLK